MNAQILSAERALVLHAAGFGPAGWVRFVANVEIDENCRDAISLFVIQDGHGLKQIDAGDPTHGDQFRGLLDPVRELWEAYSRAWEVADVVVDFTGDYSIRYGQQHRRLAEPIDLAGIAVLRDYITRHAADIPRR